jgi:hypothetical protein
MVVATDGYPTLQLRHLVHGALYEFAQKIPVYGLWDFDAQGFTQVSIVQSELTVVVCMGMWIHQNG